MIAGKHSISDEKPVPGGGSVRIVKRRIGRGYRRYGEIHRIKTAPGEPRKSIFWAKRRTDDKFIDQQAWAVAVETVDELRNYAVTHVGLAIEDGTLLLAPMVLFGPKGREQGVDRLTPKFGNEQVWLVPERLFEVSRPAAPVREETLLEQMQIKATRRGRAAKVTA